MFALAHPEYPGKYLNSLNVANQQIEFNYPENEIKKFSSKIHAYALVDTVHDMLVDCGWEKEVKEKWLILLEDMEVVEFDGFVDLGLPSGTKWKRMNEDEEDFFSFDEALKEFGKHNLPGRKDIQELVDECRSEWDESRGGRVFTGPNGNSIFFPALGYERTNDFNNPGGYYWSCSSSYKEFSYCLNFNDEGVFVTGCRRDYGCNVRLIQR